MNYVESFSDSSDDQPPASLKKKKTNVAKRGKTSRKTKRTNKQSRDGDSSSDDEPLSKTASRLQSRPKRTSSAKTSEKTTPDIKSRRTAAMYRVRYVETSSHSSDEPLASVKKRKASRRKLRSSSTKEIWEDSASSNSDNEFLIKAAKHAQVTKVVKVMVERCSIQDILAATRPNQTTTEETTAEKPAGEDLNIPEEVPEEEKAN